jgi:hypothetical protein
VYVNQIHSNAVPWSPRVSRGAARIILDLISPFEVDEEIGRVRNVVEVKRKVWEGAGGALYGGREERKSCLRYPGNDRWFL